MKWIDKLTEKEKKFLYNKLKTIYEDVKYKMFFKYLIEKTDIPKKYKLVWLVKDNSEFITSLCGQEVKCIARNQSNYLEKFEYLYYYNFAKFIIDCNGYVYKKHPAQKRVFLPPRSLCPPTSCSRVSRSL